MRFTIIGLLCMFFSLVACMKDESAYLPQDKKDVQVDQYEKDSSNPVQPDGKLLPGIHQIRLLVNHQNTQHERRFKYFMPVSIDVSKPVSLIFYFHGSVDAGVDPLEGVSLSHPLAQLAIRENCIIVFPAGEDVGAATNWQNTEYNLSFVDAMLSFFEKQDPQPDVNRIYTTGHSSGAIFTYALALNRADVFAAAVPVAGQFALGNASVPNRAVPILAINGVTDNTVIHSAAFSNIQNWANHVANYFPSDAIVSDTLQIDNYKSFLKTAWTGGTTDIEFVSLLDEGHGVNWYFITPLIWDFMSNHPRTLEQSDLYVSSEIKQFLALEGQTFRSAIRHSEGASITITSKPSDWEVSYANGELRVKAPTDFFASTTVNRKGTIVLRASSSQGSKEITLPFELLAPKAYFEVGDLIYDENFEPDGVVFWVNPTNIKEAKIIALEHVTRRFGALRMNFFTPSFTDGYGNTLALIQENTNSNAGLTASSSAFVYAYEYKAGPGQTKGWYLPAVDELKDLDAQLDAVNAALEEHGVALQIVSSALSYHMTSTVLNTGTEAAPIKRYYTYDYHSNPNFHGYYILTANASGDTAGFISTRPIKKVIKP